MIQLTKKNTYYKKSLICMGIIRVLKALVRHRYCCLYIVNPFL